MPRFAANLTMLFAERPLADRFAAAAAAGFDAVEILFPYELSPEALAAALKASGLEIVLVNLPAGDWDAGERGFACRPGSLPEVLASLESALPHIRAARCPRVHLMAGNRAPNASFEAMEAAYLESVRAVASRLAPEGVEVCLEPISRFAMPGYFLNTMEQAADYIRRLGMGNVRLQFDLFHCQMETGDVTGRLRRHFPILGHVQCASCPDRHEPDGGELNCGYVFRALDELGYGGHVGCEYVPRGRTEDGLGWLAPWGVRPRA